MSAITQQRRKWRARVVNRCCWRHNTPLVQVSDRDGAVCSLGCFHSNNVRERALRLIVDMRRWYGRNGWEHE